MRPEPEREAVEMQSMMTSSRINCRRMYAVMQCTDIGWAGFSEDLRSNRMNACGLYITAVVAE